MFDSICEKLFGIEKEDQEKLLAILLLCSLVITIIAAMMSSQAVFGAVLFIWGWRVVCAFKGMIRLGQFSEYNPVVMIIIFLVLIALGICAGAGILIIGIIRFVQLEVEKYRKAKGDD